MFTNGGRSELFVIWEISIRIALVYSVLFPGQKCYSLSWWFLVWGERIIPHSVSILWQLFKKFAEDKIVLPVKTLTFLGILCDTVAMELRLTCEKLTELRQRIKLLLGCKNTTLREIQSIHGLLNLAYQVVVLGRAFCRRLIDATCKVKSLGTKFEY